MIKNCPHNSNWIIKTFGKQEFQKISDKTILCSGTVLGQNNKILEYLDLISRYISEYRYRKKLKYLLTFRPDPSGRGCDQGHANFLVHNLKIKNLNLYSNIGGPVATVLYLKKIKFDANSRLINNSGKPYSIVHQYDKRWNEFQKPLANFKNYIKI